jgi:hypothetical protein
MFLMINLGEKAGSGLPEIYQGWVTNGGTLQLFDFFEPYNQTRLEMSWQGLGETSGKILEAIRNSISLIFFHFCSSPMESVVKRFRGRTVNGDGVKNGGTESDFDSLMFKKYFVRSSVALQP